MKLANLPLVKDMIDQGYIAARKHPDFDLYIYNYTKQTEAEHVWNEATEMCRGIICDKDYNVIARPFTKFYNYEELVKQNAQIPDLPFEVYEKLDGSLGILYFADGKPYIATRGSFDSAQAKHATNVLHTKYADVLDKLDPSKTYLFEIIYNDKEARGNLVVDYGDTDDIFLLAVIHTDSGEEDDVLDYKDLFNVVTKYDSVKDYLQFRQDQNGKNREGFVIKFSNGFRMKLKFAEYFSAHSVKSHLNCKKILDTIKNGNIFDLRKKVQGLDSEECLIYFDDVVREINMKYNDIVQQCSRDLQANQLTDRKSVAKYFLQCKYPAILFSMFDGKPFEDLVWKVIEKDA